MDNIFARFILGEAAGAPPQAPLPGAKPPGQEKEDVQQAQIPNADQMVQPADSPPDFTQGGGDQAATPGPTAGAGQPPVDGVDPNAAQGGDPAATGEQPAEDPNAAAGAEAPADPNAAAGGPTIQSPNTQIDQDEQDVFSDLKPEQMAIKKAELRDQYKTLHKVIVESLDKINKISHTTYDDSMLDFIVKRLAGLKSFVRDTLIDTFDTRTYAENKIELQRLILSTNRLTNMLTEIYQSRLKRNQKISELNRTKQPKHDVEEFPLFTRGYDVQ